MDLFTIKNLRLELGGREVLNIPALEIPDERIVALTGPNGSGKTSLMQLLGGIMNPLSGTITYRGRDLTSRTASQLDTVRRELGVVLQSPYLFKKSVLNNVCYGLLQRGLPRVKAREMAREALELVGLEGFGNRSRSALSGGEAQRVALARALVLEPDVLLLDEPFANVDSLSRSVIERALQRENQDRGTAVIFSTHDLDQAYRMADTVVTLFEGRIQDRSMENLFHGVVRRTLNGPVFDAGDLKIAVSPGRERALVATIAPESIIVSLHPISTSARNILRGRISAARERNGGIEITVDAEVTLIARLTRQSYIEMGLVLGDEVYLIFKAEAVKLY